jgi:hypothetical protein
MRISIAVLLLGCLVLSGCGGKKPTTNTTSNKPAANATANADDLPGLTRQVVDQLKTIKDEASAKAAAPKLEALADKIDAIQEQTKAGKAPAIANPDDFATRQMAAMEDYGKELLRIGEIPDAAQHLQGMIKKLAP